MNKALDFLLRYYIIYHNVFGNRYNMYKKNQKNYILHPLSEVIKRIPRFLAKQSLRFRFYEATEYFFMLN